MVSRDFWEVDVMVSHPWKPLHRVLLRQNVLIPAFVKVRRHRCSRLTARSMWLLTAAVLFLFQGDAGRATKSFQTFCKETVESRLGFLATCAVCRDETRLADEAHTWTQLSPLRTMEDQL